MNDLLALRPTAEVRGESAYNRPASLLRRNGARLANASLCVGLSAALLGRILWPEPSGAAGPLTIAESVLALFVFPALLALSLWVFGRTPGEFAAGIATRGTHGGGISRPTLSGALRSWRRAEYLTLRKPTALSRLGATILTLALSIAPAVLGLGSLSGHPFFLAAGARHLERTQTGEKPGWRELPFFFARGLWPSRFAGRPVFHSLPYEKGPPSIFVGRVIARWDPPTTQLTIEGPKTPEPRADAERLRVSLGAGWLAEPGAWARGLGDRITALRRHIGEMRAALDSGEGAATWSLEWFESGSEADSPRGIRIVATNRSRAQERFVMVSAGGAHQALILDRAAGPEGDRASETLRELVSGLRLSASVEEGRSLVAAQLSAIDPEQIPTDATPDALAARIADIHSLILARISLAPGDFEAYFHLAGTSFALSKLLARDNGAGDSTGASTALPGVIRAAYFYARDIAPADRRTTQLEQIWMESGKP